MDFHERVIELPLHSFVTSPDFKACKFPKDFEDFLLKLDFYDSNYVVRLSMKGIEVGYKSDRWMF